MLGPVGKYFLVFKNGAQNVLTYRFNIFAWFVSESLSLLAMSYVWLSIYRQGGQIGSYSLRSLIAYFILAKLVNMVVVAGDASSVVADDINQGRLNNFILKPLSYFWFNFSRSLGNLAVSLAMYSLPLALAFIYFNSQLVFGKINLLFFLAFLVLANALNFVIFYILGLLTFYLESIIGPGFMMWLLVSLFSGRIVPLDILPPGFLAIANWLPFKYIIFVPLQAIGGKLGFAEMFLALSAGLAWLLALALVAKLFYQRGLIKYESYGI
jgi:ABC-2 type transport system permease protein